MDAAAMFLIRHERMHAHVERLTDGLIAWLLWHIARAEDCAVNLLVCGAEQVLDDTWCTRLNIDRRDVGTGMTMAEVLELSARLDLAALPAYWQSVEERTVDVVASLRRSALDEAVSPADVHRFVFETTTEPARASLEQLFQDRTRGEFLAWLPLTHNHEHIGQADLIRGLLGHPSRF